MVEPFVVVMNSDRQHPFGMGLTDHVIVQHLADIGRRWRPVTGFYQRVPVLFTDNIHAELYTFIADKDGWAGD